MEQLKGESAASDEHDVNYLAISCNMQPDIHAETLNKHPPGAVSVCEMFAEGSVCCWLLKWFL